MKKHHYFIIGAIAIIALGWYGYKNWGWFGGTRTLASMMPQSNPASTQNLPPKSTEVNTNPVR